MYFHCKDNSIIDVDIQWFRYPQPGAVLRQNALQPALHSASATHQILQKRTSRLEHLPQDHLRPGKELQENLKKKSKPYHSKYLEPKYSTLLTAFKKQLTTDQVEEIETHRTELKAEKSRTKDNHELNRTLSLLGKEFGELRANAEKLDRFEPGDLSEE